MGTESEFSSGGSDHDDSDTIVISSRSRILISPRKKGSKAVSNLLGTAADDVIEQLLRGSDSRLNVISKSNRATVRVNNHEYNVHDDDRQSANSKTAGTMTGTARQPRQRGATTSAENSVNRTIESRVSHSRTRQTHVADVISDNAGESSELSSGGEQSALSSDEGEHHRRVSRGHQQQQSRQALQRTAATAAPPEYHHHRQNEGHQHAMDSGHGSDCFSDDAEDDESDASGSTKGSSLSQREREARSSGHRKFDDQLHVPAESIRQATKPQRKERRDTQDEKPSTRRAAKPQTNRDRVSRREGMSDDLDDSVILPTSATQEMEDLKQTLKNLAHQDPLLSAPTDTKKTKPFLLSNPPKKSAQFPGSTQGGDQVREQEYVGPQARQNGYEEVAWSATTSALTRFEEATTKKTGKSSSTERTRDRKSENDTIDSDRSETPIARRLFSTPPPHAVSKLSTPPTVPVSVAPKRTPSPQVPLFGASNGYPSSMLDTSLTVAAASSAQGSRAVLSALKALQDKIRRLEEEREKLMQELSDIKVKARKREAEFASSEKKLTYELGQTKESARAAYDAIRSEKEELKLELVKFTERRKAMEAELQHVHKLASTLSAKADDLQSQLQSSESQRNSQRAELEETRGAHSQEVRDLRAEMLALQKEQETAQEQIKMLQGQLQQEAQNYAETRERLHESEQAIAGITQLNDKLVSKVWEANEIATKATKKSKKLQQSQRVSTLARPTAASRAASVSAATGATTPGRSGSISTKKTRTGSIAAKGAASVKKEKRGGQSMMGNNNLELLRAANMGRDIPFVLGTSANRSHSIISNVQEALRQCDTTYATPVTNPPPPPTYLKPRKNSARVRKASVSGSDQAYGVVRMGTSASILGMHGPETASTLVGARTKSQTSNRSGSDAAHSASSKRPSAIRVPTPSTSYPNPVKSQIMDDLQVAVESAEAEFTTLNRKYKDAAAKVESGRDGSAQLARSLGSMLDELEAKGKQLNLLKQVYEQASRSTINPTRHVVHSPEAVQRKTASLRVLNDYRQMERDAKSPRSAAGTPGSPARTNTTSRRGSFFSDD